MLSRQLEPCGAHLKRQGKSHPTLTKFNRLIANATCLNGTEWFVAHKQRNEKRHNASLLGHHAQVKGRDGMEGHTTSLSSLLSRYSDPFAWGPLWFIKHPRLTCSFCRRRTCALCLAHTCCMGMNLHAIARCITTEPCDGAMHVGVYQMTACSDQAPTLTAGL